MLEKHRISLLLCCKRGFGRCIMKKKSLQRHVTWKSLRSNDGYTEYMYNVWIYKRERGGGLRMSTSIIQLGGWSIIRCQWAAIPTHLPTPNSTAFLLNNYLGVCACKIQITQSLGWPLVYVVRCGAMELKAHRHFMVDLIFDFHYSRM